jgi:predicted ester cyclase
MGGAMGEALEAAKRYDEAYNAQDAQTRAATLTTDVEFVSPGGINLRGPEQIAELQKAFWEALPDGTITYEHHVEAGEEVVIEGHLSGTHTGTFRSPQGDIPPTGNPVRLRYASIRRVEGGKIASEHLYFDQLEFLTQIGANPGPAAGRGDAIPRG